MQRGFQLREPPSGHPAVGNASHARITGGNAQIVTAPDGWPFWTAPIVPADLGYLGENNRMICPIEKSSALGTNS